MRLFLLATLTAASLFGNTMMCGVTVKYRCKNGNVGLVRAHGPNYETAKVAARKNARKVCSGMVDYVRYQKNANNC